MKTTNVCYCLVYGIVGEIATHTGSLRGARSVSFGRSSSGAEPIQVLVLRDCTSAAQFIVYRGALRSITVPLVRCSDYVALPNRVFRSCRRNVALCPGHEARCGPPRRAE